MNWSRDMGIRLSMLMNSVRCVMKKLRMLLTGGSGLVGRNLLEHSSIGDYDVLAPRSSELDLRDFGAVELFLRKFQPDIVVHAAGKVGGIQANLNAPIDFLVENLDLGRNIVLASYQSGIKRLLNLGSSCMYPRNRIEPLREEMVLQGELEPSNEGYALAKIVTLRLCEYIMRQDGSCMYRTLIPCNLYGRYDKFDPAQSHLLPAIIDKLHKALREGSSEVEIWGDGTARREFMFAGDLANAVLRATNDFSTVPNCMNVGLGHDYSIDEYYQTTAEVMGYRGRFVHNLEKPVGMARKLVNIERQTAWGWSPHYALKDGIRETYQYYLEECSQ
jgi:GDP-L-fucose synthase